MIDVACNGNTAQRNAPNDGQTLGMPLHISAAAIPAPDQGASRLFGARRWARHANASVPSTPHTRAAITANPRGPCSSTPAVMAGDATTARAAQQVTAMTSVYAFAMLTRFASRDLDRLVASR